MMLRLGSSLGRLGGKYNFSGKMDSFFGEVNGTGQLQVRPVGDSGRFVGKIDFIPNKNFLFFSLKQHPITGSYQEGALNHGLIKVKSPLGEVLMESNIASDTDMNVKGSVHGFPFTGMLKKKGS